MANRHGTHVDFNGDGVEPQRDPTCAAEGHSHRRADFHGVVAGEVGIDEHLRVVCGAVEVGFTSGIQGLRLVRAEEELDLGTRTANGEATGRGDDAGGDDHDESD